MSFAANDTAPLHLNASLKNILAKRVYRHEVDPTIFHHGMFLLRRALKLTGPNLDLLGVHRVSESCAGGCVYVRMWGDGRSTATFTSHDTQVYAGQTVSP